MNWVDFLIILTFLLNIATGLKTGLVIGALELVRQLISIVVAFLTYTWAAAVWRALGVPPEPSIFLGFFLMMGLTQAIIAITWHPLTEKIKESIKDKSWAAVNKAGGPLPQFIMLLIGTSLFLAMAILHPIYIPLKEAVLESRLGKPLAQPSVMAISGGRTIDEVENAPSGDSV